MNDRHVISRITITIGPARHPGFNTLSFYITPPVPRTQHIQRRVLHVVNNEAVVVSGLAAVGRVSPPPPGTSGVILDPVEESFDGDLVVVGTF